MIFQKQTEKRERKELTEEQKAKRAEKQVCLPLFDNSWLANDEACLSLVKTNTLSFIGQYYQYFAFHWSILKIPVSHWSMIRIMSSIRLIMASHWPIMITQSSNWLKQAKRREHFEKKRQERLENGGKEEENGGKEEPTADEVSVK